MGELLATLKAIEDAKIEQINPLNAKLDPKRKLLAEVGNPWTDERFVVLNESSFWKMDRRPHLI
jgi:hypothetical protein